MSSLRLVELRMKGVGVAMSLRQRILTWAQGYATSRPPDFVVGDRQLERWWLIPRNRIFNIYLHRFNGSDEDRALHDHMYYNLSWILGPSGYWEKLFTAPPKSGEPLPSTRMRWLRAESLTLRRPSLAHQVILTSSDPVYTIFVTGPRVRQWGFWCPGIGWRHWREFVSDRDAGQVGKGCE